MVDNIKNEFIKMCEENYKKTGYDYWNNHIKYVLEIASSLAIKYNADIEIVAISAILHDIAKVLEVRIEESHNIVGSEIVSEILEKYSISKNKIKQIKNCILKHSGEVDTSKLTIEEWCVRNADSISVLNNITILYYLAFSEYRMNYESGKQYIKDILQTKFNNIDKKLQSQYKNQYNNIISAI